MSDGGENAPLQGEVLEAPENGLVTSSHLDASRNHADGVLEEGKNALPGSTLEMVEPKTAPREGTLAWLQTLEHVDVHGLELPRVHRVPSSATLHEADGGSCRVLLEERGRCRAPATKLYGVCLVHAGGGGITDPVAMSAKANANKAKLRARRQLLGIGPHRGANPRQIARVAALERASDVAEALLAPLDDGALPSMARQAAAVRLLDATWPLQQTTVEVELPADSEGVEALSWAQLQALAHELLA